MSLMWLRVSVSGGPWALLMLIGAVRTLRAEPRPQWQFLLQTKTSSESILKHFIALHPC